MTLATITDRSRMLDEPIPFVAPETVRRAAIAVIEDAMVRSRATKGLGDVAIATVERFGSEAGDVLSMLGINRETLRGGLGYADGAA